MNTIRMTSDQHGKLKDALLCRKEESAVFLVAGFFENKSGVHFVVRDVLVPKDDDYESRGVYHIQVSPIFFNRAISLAEANRVTVIQCHSHPFDEGQPSYSPTDDRGESISSKTLYDCLNGVPMGSLLFGKNKITGRVWLSPGKKPVPIDELRLVDRHFRIRNLVTQKKSKIDPDVYARQILAFGMKGQETLSSLKIGIVGLGGTGSSVAEQLAREGIGNFIIIDHDKFQKSNKTRLYGSYSTDGNCSKTEIVKRNILKIQPSALVKTIEAKITSERDLDVLKECDIVFGCTDRHMPRGLLSNFSHQYFIPVIDVGVGLNAQDGKLLGGTVRATLISPTLPCLFCTGIVSPEKILAESLPEDERKKREVQGYITGLEDDAPSVVNFTTMAATFGLLLLKDLLFEIVDTTANTISLDIVSFKTSRLAASVKQDCVCQARLGKGDRVRGGEC